MLNIYRAEAEVHSSYDQGEVPPLWTEILRSDGFRPEGVEHPLPTPERSLDMPLKYRYRMLIKAHLFTQGTQKFNKC